MDHVEQPHRLAGFVGLQPADAMKDDVWMTRAKLGPFAGRLLDSILAEIALTGRDELLDLLGGAALADGDQLNIRRLTQRERRRLGDSFEDEPPTVSRVAHAGPVGKRSEVKIRT